MKTKSFIALLAVSAISMFVYSTNAQVEVNPETVQ